MGGRFGISAWMSVSVVVAFASVSVGQVQEQKLVEPCVLGDLNGDGSVNAFDFAIFAPAYGTECAEE